MAVSFLEQHLLQFSLYQIASQSLLVLSVIRLTDGPRGDWNLFLLALQQVACWVRQFLPMQEIQQSLGK